MKRLFNKKSSKIDLHIRTPARAYFFLRFYALRIQYKLIIIIDWYCSSSAQVAFSHNNIEMFGHRIHHTAHVGESIAALLVFYPNQKIYAVSLLIS